MQNYGCQMSNVKKKTKTVYETTVEQTFPDLLENVRECKNE